ncbi:MAG TPA: GNAT family N-acetyltransferase [Thermoleophilaceae bacterium]|nr:GNAT family N-acetyltransferase [Thermoleophilaceae bacterium]
MDVEIRTGGTSADVNTIVRLHGEVYESEFGLDPSFASDIALRLAEMRRGGWPSAGEGVWIAEADGRAVGSITLYDLGGGLGRLGHLVLTPEARGSGTGRRLVETVLEAARAAGYERLELATFSDLQAAGGLYRSVGFVKVSGERTTRWGREMEWERYELAL